MATWSMMSFQNGNSSLMEQLIFFHDYSMLIINMIIMTILFMMIKLMMNIQNNKFIIQNQFIEIMWTITPMMILFFLAIPSLQILYLEDEIFKPMLTIKSMGHQWYWSYEYSDFKNLEFNSYMKEYTKKEISLFRNLDVDNRLIIPFKSPIRMLITSTDVIHSWTIPALGIKIDAIPGRINQTSISSNLTSIMFGQCSEICGMNHSYMPIVLESTDFEHFKNWLNSMFGLPMEISQEETSMNLQKTTPTEDNFIMKAIKNMFNYMFKFSNYQMQLFKNNPPKLKLPQIKMMDINTHPLLKPQSLINNPKILELSKPNPDYESMILKEMRRTNSKAELLDFMKPTNNKIDLSKMEPLSDTPSKNQNPLHPIPVNQSTSNSPYSTPTNQPSTSSNSPESSRSSNRTTMFPPQYVKNIQKMIETNSWNFKTLFHSPNSKKNK